MKTIKNIVLAAAAAFALSACAADTANKPAANVAAATANANANADKRAAAAPAKEAIMAIEKQAWEAWKAGDMTAFHKDVMSDKYVGFNSGKRVDKAGSLAAFNSQKCEVRSYSFSDDQMHMLGSDVAVLSFRAAQDATCGGTKIPADVWASSAYIREGDKWKAAYYSEAAVTDPKTPTPKAGAPIAASPAASPDALTTELLAVEKRAWDAWVKRDVKGIEDVMAKDFAFVSGSGRQDRAGAVKAWSEPKCEGLAYTFGEPMATSLSKDAAVVTYKADVKGTCNGKAVAPTLWVASFSTKEGDTWKNAYYTDLNR